jgi:hypothetical protein
MVDVLGIASDAKACPYVGVKPETKMLDQGNNPPFIIRYRLGQCPRVAAEEKNMLTL